MHLSTSSRTFDESISMRLLPQKEHPMWYFCERHLTDKVRFSQELKKVAECSQTNLGTKQLQFPNQEV